MRKQYQSHIIAFVGTLIILCLILLLLWFLHVKAPVLTEEEGITVVFGDAEEGGGMPDVSYQDELTQVEQIPAPTMAARPTNNDLLVQDYEESLSLAKQSSEEAKRKAEQEELLRKRKAEQARIEAERVAKEKALAEQKAREQEAINKANDLAALFGQAGTADGANGSSNAASSTQGNPVGKGKGEYNGMKWNLDGRNLKSLPQPTNDFTQEGIVKVQIWVDKDGNVTNAKVMEAVVDRHTQQLALIAARKAKFTSGNTPQIGEITYIFKFK